MIGDKYVLDSYVYKVINESEHDFLLERVCDGRIWVQTSKEDKDLIKLED